MLAEIQDELANALRANPYFADIPVITEHLGDIENQIEIAVGEIGTCIIIVTPVANVKYPDLPGPFYDEIRIVARVLENVIVNQGATGTRKHALNTAEKAVSILHLFRPFAIENPVIVDNPTIILGNDPDRLSYDLNFKTDRGTIDVPPAAAAPVISRDSGGNVVMTSATGGAAIFWCSDAAHHPAPRSGTLYLGPFAAPPQTLFRARAWLAGYQTSNETKVRI